MQLNLCSGSVISLMTLFTLCSISLQEKPPLFILVWNNQRPLLSQPADSIANGHDVQLRIKEERGGDWVEILNSNHFIWSLINDLQHLAPEWTWNTGMYLFSSLEWKDECKENCAAWDQPASLYLQIWAFLSLRAIPTRTHDFCGSLALLAKTGNH